MLNESLVQEINQWLEDRGAVFARKAPMMQMAVLPRYAPPEASVEGVDAEERLVYIVDGVEEPPGVVVVKPESWREGLERGVAGASKVFVQNVVYVPQEQGFLPNDSVPAYIKVRLDVIPQ